MEKRLSFDGTRVHTKRTTNDVRDRGESERDGPQEDDHPNTPHSATKNGKRRDTPNYPCDAVETQRHLSFHMGDDRSIMMRTMKWREKERERRHGWDQCEGGGAAVCHWDLLQVRESSLLSH